MSIDGKFSRIQERFFVKPNDEAVPRLIIIDGCNVARSSCGAGRENVCCAGLMAVIRYLVIRDLDVVVFLPVIYNNPLNTNTTNAQVLPKLHELDVVTFTPARTAHGSRQAFANYDDLYALEFAERHGGSVVSSDRFIDIAADTSYSQFRHIIKERRIGVKFRALTDHFVYYGRDCFFRCLPVLRIYGSDEGRPIIERAQRRLFCLANDRDFSKVMSRRSSWSSQRRDLIVQTIDELFGEIIAKYCIIPKVISYPSISSTTDELQISVWDDRTETRNRLPSQSWTRLYRIPLTLTVSEIAKRWLSPAMCEASEDIQDRNSPPPNIDTQTDGYMVGLYHSTETASPVASEAASLPSSSSICCLQSVLSISSLSGVDADGHCSVNEETNKFDPNLVQRVLEDNISRDADVIADICAQTV